MTRPARPDPNRRHRRPAPATWRFTDWAMI